MTLHDRRNMIYIRDLQSLDLWQGSFVQDLSGKFRSCRPMHDLRPVNLLFHNRLEGP